MRYRSDIDGLRAVAVLPVVLFHVGFSGIAPGGYIGVDVFFVISGYLITRIIYNDIASGTYSIFDFYARRARRILPAAIPVYMATVIISAFLLFPNERSSAVQSTVASIMFVSNILFYTKTGYFNEAGKTNPMLHTWSLSVEEQFYIVLPIMIMMLTRAGRGVRNGGFVLVTVLSLAGACVFVTRNPNLVFYLLPFRMWELLFGSLLAIGAIPSLSRRSLAQGAAFVGLALIVGSILRLDEYSIFPAWNAIPACLGAGLILHAGSTDGDTVVARFLSLSPVRFVGLISYSLYLWHWPLIVFAPYVIGAITPINGVLLLLVSIGLATLSWRFVERPFRAHLPSDTSRLPTLGWSAATLGVIAAAALAMPPVVAMVWPITAPAQSMLAQGVAPQAEWREGHCFLSSHASPFEASTCLQLSSTKRNVLLLGDSHAAQYYPGLRARSDFNILQATASGCRPVLPLAGTERCTQMLDETVNTWLARQQPIDLIIVAAKWRRDDGPGLAVMIERLRRHARDVLVLGPIVEYVQPLPRIVAALRLTDVDRFDRFRDPDIAARDIEIGTATRRAGARYVSIYKVICPGHCRVITADHHVMQFDYGHLTVPGSIEVIDQILPQIIPGIAPKLVKTGKLS